MRGQSTRSLKPLMALLVAVPLAVSAETYTLPDDPKLGWQCTSSGSTVTCDSDVTVGSDDEVRVDASVDEWKINANFKAEQGAKVNADGSAPDLTISVTGNASVKGTQDSGDSANDLVAADDRVVADITTEPSGGSINIQQGSDVVGSIDSNGQVTTGSMALITGSVEADGDIDTSQNSEIGGDVTAIGDNDVTINQGSRVGGSVESGGDVDAGSQTEVDGSITSEGDIDFGQQATVGGDVESTDDGDISTSQSVEIDGTVDSAGAVDFGQANEIAGKVTTVGDADVSQNTVIGGRLKVTGDGDVTLESNSTVDGYILNQGSDGDTTIESNATVDGHVISTCNDVTANSNALITGCGIAGTVDNNGATIEGGIIETCGDGETIREADLDSQGEVAGLAGQTTRASSATVIYQAQYEHANWTGELRAIDVDEDNIGLGGGDAAKGNDAEWQAGAELSAMSDPVADRNIYSYSHVDNDGIRFKWADLDATQKSELKDPGESNSTQVGQGLVDYLRGDRSNEGSRGCDDCFRQRDGLLGPIINSKPALSAGLDLGFNQLSTDVEGHDSYKDFIDERRNVVYAGANDGMLHAFDTHTNDGGTGGEELFAFVPDESFSKFRDFAGHDEFRHYFVDGSPKIAHAYVDTGGGSHAWSSILLGSTGAGGESVFALEVTEPTSFGADDVLWEFEHDDLGHSTGQPTFAATNDDSNRWVALFGDGYGGSETAQLFIRDLETGDKVKHFDTGVGSQNNPNGLIGITPFDADGDRVTDVIYAGDLHGNLWKFDLTGDDVSEWEFAYRNGGNPEPLFSAGFRDRGEEHRQPITAPPKVGPGPDPTNFMVYFGTGERGRVLADQNPIDKVSDSDDIQTMYGVLDDGAGGLGRGELWEQEIQTEVDKNDRRFRVISDDPSEANFEDESGWYLDLLSPGESEPDAEVVTSSAQLERGLRRPRLIFTSVVLGEGRCGLGSDSWLMEVDAMTGGRLDQSLFDVNDDGSINRADRVTDDAKVATGRRLNAVVSQPLVVGDGGGSESLLMGDALGGIQEVDQSTWADQREGWIELE